MSTDTHDNTPPQTARRTALGLIGAGNMAEAIVRGALAAGLLDPREILAADPSPERRTVFESMGVETTEDGAEVVGRCARVMLSVKPQTLPKLASVLAETGDQLVFSIMAGVRAATILELMAGGKEAADAEAGRVIRVMPNTPLMVGHGMSAISPAGGATPEDVDFIRRLFAASGEVVEVDEEAMDAVTAVSGSGPAYLFYLAEAMERAAQALNLGAAGPMLVRQTLLGAAELLIASEEGPTRLREKVTSPGGTTHAAICTFDKREMSNAVIAGILAAAERSEELGRP